MNSEKNAVFQEESKALENQVYKTADEIRATPVVVGNKLFVGNHNTGDLFAFDVKTGEKLWQTEAPNWVHSEMIFYKNKLYVGFGNRFFKENEIRGTGESGVLALDASTGEVLWKYRTNGEVMPTPAIYNENLYIVSGDHHLYKLDSDTGTELHKEDLTSYVSMSSPAIAEDTLYVGAGKPKPYILTAYDLSIDDIKWRTEFPDVFSGLDDVPPAVSNGVVITTGLTGDKEKPNHYIYALEQETGEVIWKQLLGTGTYVKNNKSGAPMIYKDKIYVGSPITKTFYAFDLKTGEKLWKFEDEVMKAPPVAQDGIVYFSNTKGYVRALDAQTGKLVGEKKLNGVLAPSGPIIVNDTLFVGSQDSNVYAVPLDDIVEEKESNKKTVEAADKYESVNKESDSSKWSYVFVGLLLCVLAIVLFLMFKKRR
nr:PQQ-binding-like beta-propeller repeat protein [Virgibacillus halodenitrificans]